MLSGADIGNAIAVAGLTASASAVVLLLVTRSSLRGTRCRPHHRALQGHHMLLRAGIDPPEESDGVKASEKVPARSADS